MKKYIVTNIAYGTGPYLRITELCIAFNDEMEKRGEARIPFIVPWIYGDKQKNIMLEEFAGHEKKYPGEILLDAQLGSMLKSIFYTGEKRYEETLRTWVENAPNVSKKVHEYLSGEFEVETLSGERSIVQGKNIVLEINRSPRLLYNVAPAYSSTFGYIAEILEKALQAGRGEIDIDPELLKKGIILADSIEGTQDVNTMAYPATFTWQAGYISRYKGEILVPPITNLPKKHILRMKEGIYVTITGIEGLDRLYHEARELGLKLYSNDTIAVEGAEKALPHVIPNPAKKLQFARSGWGSVWLSIFCGTPIVVPEFDPTDDPEIYFNNKAVEGLDIGIVYHGQPLSFILTEIIRLQENSKILCAEIQARWGTLNGNVVCAKLFVDKFIASL